MVARWPPNTAAREESTAAGDDDFCQPAANLISQESQVCRHGAARRPKPSAQSAPAAAASAACCKAAAGKTKTSAPRRPLEESQVRRHCGQVAQYCHPIGANGRRERRLLPHWQLVVLTQQVTVDEGAQRQRRPATVTAPQCRRLPPEPLPACL